MASLNSKLSCVFEDSLKWTVGDVKDLHCQGALPDSFSPPLKVQFSDPAQKYSLVILASEKINKDNLHLKVTSYQTGSFQNISFVIADKDNKNVSVENLSYSVESVLKRAEPYPPYGPWGMAFPLWYKGAWLFLFGFFLFLMIMQLRKIYLRKKMEKQTLKRLKEKTPIQYFIHQLSQFFLHSESMKDHGIFIEKLNQSLREFLENQFLISEKTQDSAVLKQLKKEKLKTEFIKKISQIFIEIEQMKTNSADYSDQDRRQLLGMVRDWVFEYERNKK